MYRERERDTHTYRPGLSGRVSFDEFLGGVLRLKGQAPRHPHIRVCICVYTYIIMYVCIYIYIYIERERDVVV